MKTDEINRAIAEACGASRFVGLKKRGLWYRPNAGGYTDRESEAGRYTLEEAKLREYIKGDPDEWVTICVFSIPNYHADLNAMHEAEKVLVAQDKWQNYITRLNEQICCDDDEPINVDPETLCNMIRATAAQRAEAFLRTLGKWK